LRELVAGLGGRTVASDSPAGKAQALLDRAYREMNPHLRANLATQALAIDPDCADAYVLLAEAVVSRRAALDLYAKGVAAGERALGPEPFQRQVGHFWGVLETRPYMRARLGLANSLWSAGRRDEAIAHLQDMLRLNPNDNQGVRYTLAGFLFREDRDDELARLLAKFGQDTLAMWAYNRALLAFRQEGDTENARILLQAAIRSNRHVPEYLLQRKTLPAQSPDHYSPGDDTEARVYAEGNMAAWRDTPGAIAWLRAYLQPARKPASPAAKGPLGFIKTWLLEHLPQHDDVWQVDVRAMPNWIRVGDQPVRPLTVLVTSRTNDLVLQHEMLTEEPSAAMLWDVLVRAMREPAADDAHRPTQVEVRPDERWDSLRPHLEAIGVTLCLCAELQHFNAVFEDLSVHISGEPQAGLLDIPDVSEELGRRFFETAAEFFRQSLWRKVGYESAIRIESPSLQNGPWFGVLMGQSGMTRGLALYEDLDTIRRILSTDVENTADGHEAACTAVIFGEEWDVCSEDVDAATKFGWPVARSDGWPSIIRTEGGTHLRQPLVWELSMVEACLRAVPNFVRVRKQGDPTPMEVTVAGESGPLQMTLSWVAGNG
jgi:tetratricopeptide (TPR) repeat protein